MPQIGNPILGALEAGQSAAQIGKLSSETQRTKSENELTKEKTREMTEKVAQATHQAEILGYEASYKQWFMDMELEQRRTALKVAQQQAEIMSREAGRAGTAGGVLLGWIKEIVDSLSPFTGTAPQLMR